MSEETYTQRFYRFESEIIGWTEADESEEALTDFLLRVWARFRDGNQPTLFFTPHPKSENACATGTRDNLKIHLPEGFRTRRVLAHELTHAMLRRMRLENEEPHGGIFAATYFRLLQDELGYDYRRLKESAEEFGLEVKSPVFYLNPPDGHGKMSIVKIPDTTKASIIVFN